MLSFILLSAFFCTVLTQGHHEFHCTFGNYTYDYELRPGYVAEFGDGDKVPALEFYTADEYRTFLEVVDDSFREIFTNSVYNDATPFFKFFELYALQTINHDEDSIAFYNGYSRTIFTETSGSHFAAFVIKIFHQIRESTPIPVAESSYLIRVVRNVVQSEEENFNRHFQFNPSDVAGVIKVSICGKPGFLIIDPSKGMLSETVMMDGSKFHRGSAIERLADSFDFALVDRYVRSKSRQDADALWDLYEVKLPFCSFVRTTIKPRLLKREHSAMSFWPTGQVKERLTFKVDYANDDIAIRLSQTTQEGITSDIFWSVYDNSQLVRIRLMKNIMAGLKMDWNDILRCKEYVRQICLNNLFISFLRKTETDR